MAFLMQSFTPNILLLIIMIVCQKYLLAYNGGRQISELHWSGQLILPYSHTYFLQESVGCCNLSCVDCILLAKMAETGVKNHK